MKTAALIFIFVSALYCVPNAWSQAVGGGGSGGGGLRSNISYSACEEGRRVVQYETVGENGRLVLVERICRNGSYYDLSNYLYDPVSQCSWEYSEIFHRLVKTRSGKIERRHYRCINYRWQAVEE